MLIHLCVSATEFKVILDHDSSQYCVIAPPQFASPDEALNLFQNCIPFASFTQSIFDSLYYFNVIHIYIGCQCQLVL